MMVATAARHRADAFAAAEFLMDYLKSRAPFWKKEITRRAGHLGRRPRRRRSRGVRGCETPASLRRVRGCETPRFLRRHRHFPPVFLETPPENTLYAVNKI
jgi:hypothetical protein